MTRAADVATAVSLGADYIGCIFAGGPRHQTADSAAQLVNSVRPDPRPLRVGVVSGANGQGLPAVLDRVRLEVLQIHGDSSPADIAALRSRTTRVVWAVLRCEGTTLPVDAPALWQAADGVLLDTRVAGRLGGSGVPLPWEDLAEQIARLRQTAPADRTLALAGGLTPENVGRAIAVLHPDIVDTSSGVESSPGVKDPARMRAFVEAVADADRVGAH
jgi:phosphoribosylanthranilate isomerase